MPERPPHTSLLVERRQGDEANQQTWGLLGDHDGQRSMGEFDQDAEVTPLLLSKDILGFLMTRESGPWSKNQSTFLFDPCLIHRDTVMLEKKRVQSKLLL